jgi:hypothetical protein
MELTRRETQILLYAISLAIQKETRGVELLKSEGSALGIKAAIIERTNQLAELDRLRERLQQNI